MDQARHVDARHASNKSQQPVRRPPAGPHKKISVGQPAKTRTKPATRCTTQRQGGALEPQTADMVSEHLYLKIL